MMSQFTYRLDELDSSAVGVAGGKGASLGELVRAGAPVPPALVIASTAFETFMNSGDHRQFVDDVVRQLNASHITAAAASERIISYLGSVPMPSEVVHQVREAVARLGAQSVAVRSSATCEDSATSAWAGQLDTYLDVRPPDVVEKVRKCWLSIFGESALAYSAVHGFDTGRIAVAVVVQQMVASDVSGIGFSVHPVTQEPNLLLIEACFGLGEAIVSGKINPDQYVVERATGKIVEHAVGDQDQGLFLEPGAATAEWRDLDERGKLPKLNDDQVVEYARLLSRIQDHYGHPVDTEWALEGGEFRVLQARPITTLADEYTEAVVDTSHEWQPLVRRPMSLVEVSIWAHWLDSRHAAECLGLQANRALSIQDDAGLTNEFLTRRAMDAGLGHVADLLKNHRSQAIENLKRGQTTLVEAQVRIDRGPDAFADLDEAVDFFVDAAQFTTVFPAWVLIAYEQQQLDDPEVRSLAEAIRTHTLYPSIEREIIDPLVRRATQALNFSAPQRSTAVVTWSELRRGNLTRDLLEARLEQIDSGRRFVFQSLDGSDQVRFVSQSGYLLMRLARQRQIVPKKQDNELFGQAAWPGIYRGRARLVLSADAVGKTIEEGEVLVSIQSSPELMPLLQRCGAIVTDDGGIACHAAIIARELRKPTLIGTKTATSMIHTGDLVEVDTYAQVVRVLERAAQT